MKRLKIMLVLILAFSLNGCVEEYKVTDKQSDAVAEYSAGKLLQYDENYDKELPSYEELLGESNEEDSSEQPAGESTGNNEDAKSQDEKNDTEINQSYSLTEVIGEKGFDIQYKDYKKAETYPDDEENPYFSLTARDGYELFVISFIVKNTKNNDKDFDLSKADIVYRLDIGSGKTYKPQFTLLVNDLRYIDLTIKGNKAETALLVFEVPEKADMSITKLTVSKDDKSKTIEIK